MRTPAQPTDHTLAAALAAPAFDSALDLPVHRIADDGITLWYNDPAAYRHSGASDRTYFAYADAQGRAWVASLDHDSGETQATLLANFAGRDDHLSPAVHVIQSGPHAGQVLVAASFHTSTLFVWRGTAGEDISAMQLVAQFDGYYTYPAIRENADGYIRIYARHGYPGADAHKGQYDFLASSDGGVSWDTAQPFITSATDTIVYALPIRVEGDEMFVAWTLFDRATSTHQGLYWSVSHDGGATWEGKDGPVTVLDETSAFRLTDAANVRVYDAALVDGEWLVSWAAFDSEYASPDLGLMGTGRVSDLSGTVLTQTPVAINYYADGIRFDPVDPHVLYVPSASDGRSVIDVRAYSAGLASEIAHVGTIADAALHTMRPAGVAGDAKAIGEMTWIGARSYDRYSDFDTALLASPDGIGLSMYSGAASAVTIDLAEDGGAHVIGSAFDDTIAGNDAANRLWGFAGADRLEGREGDDYLDGGSGADVMLGGPGDDTYAVDRYADQVIELAGDGNDTVVSPFGLVLADHVENLVITGAASYGVGNALDNVVIGNAGDNILHGKDGNDVIDGGGGADRMVGGPGDDIYHLDRYADRVVELAGQGIDLVVSPFGTVLPDHTENLTITGKASYAVGNALANVLTGNALDNIIRGEGGDDTLDGGTGSDKLAGGMGDDTYLVDRSGDRVVEADGEGTDTVVSPFGFVLPTHVENLIITDGATFAVGNGLPNSIIGNALANTMRGEGGDDILSGGPGADVLDGGAGSDIFLFDSALGADNVDRLRDFAAQDEIWLARTVYTGLTADGALAPSAFTLGSNATSASHRILYDAGNGRIFYDADGSGTTAPVLFATVSPGTSLDHTDFRAFSGSGAAATNPAMVQLWTNFDEPLL